MKQLYSLVLRVFGYRGKLDSMIDAIYHARILNREADERIRRLKATLNGEDKWFIKGENDERDNARSGKHNLCV